jgi:hypothetical protein
MNPLTRSRFSGPPSPAEGASKGRKPPGATARGRGSGGRATQFCRPQEEMKEAPRPGGGDGAVWFLDQRAWDDTRSLAAS